LKQKKEHGRSALAVVAALAKADEVSRWGQGDAGWGVSPRLGQAERSWTPRHSMAQLVASSTLPRPAPSVLGTRGAQPAHTMGPVVSATANWEGRRASRALGRWEHRAK